MADPSAHLSATDEYSFVLRPSSIAGIGVFARHSIAKDAVLRLFPDDEIVRTVPRSSVENDPDKRRFYEWYCVEDTQADVYYCAPDFSRMSIGWYLNHSATPNVVDRGGVFYAVQDITEGEELTLDYGLLEPHREVIEFS